MEWLYYITKVGGVFTLLYSVYFLLFRKNTYFQLNRVYLLAIIPLSFILPILNSTTIINTQFSIELPTVELLNIQSTVSSVSSWNNILPLVYFIISFLLAIYLIINTIKVIHTISKLKSGELDSINPFSFFSFIYIPPTVESENKQAIIDHEKVHSLQKHSFDIYLYELTKIILWWNPFVWIALKSVKNNHEFIADKLASEKTNNYSSVLIAQLLGVNCSELGNNFNYEPLIKKRIMMMKTKKSKRLSILKYALAIPVIAISLAATSANNLPIKESSISEVQDEKVLSKVDEMPEFKGGMEKLMTYLGENIIYPEVAKKAGTQGTVYVSFVVDKKGGIKDVEIVKSANTLLDEESKRVISSMPKWTPGKHKGELVEVQLTLPIKFQL